MSSVIDYYSMRVAELRTDPEPLPSDLLDLLLAVNMLRLKEAHHQEQPDPEWIGVLEADAAFLRSLPTYEADRSTPLF
jgi:hypothetical protein